MHARISKISLTIFAVMLVLGGFQLSVAGEYWFWFAVTAIFAVVPVVIGPRKHKLIGVGALILSLLLIIGDYQTGKRFRAKLHRAPAGQSSVQTTAYSATIELTGTPGAAFSGDYDRKSKRVAFSGVLPWTLTESNISRLEIRKAKMEDSLVLRARIGGSSFSAPSGPDSKGVRLESDGGWRMEFIR